MTEHKFTDDELTKILECCITVDGCKNCINSHKGDMCQNIDDVVRQVIALINRQKAEIERLNADIDGACIFLEEYRKISKQEHENQIEMLNRMQEQIPLAIARARNEVIKEFAERLCEGRVSNDAVVIATKCLVKEMTEGKT